MSRTLEAVLPLVGLIAGPIVGSFILSGLYLVLYLCSALWSGKAWHASGIIAVFVLENAIVGAGFAALFRGGGPNALREPLVLTTMIVAAVVALGCLCIYDFVALTSLTISLVSPRGL